MHATSSVMAAAASCCSAATTTAASSPSSSHVSSHLTFRACGAVVDNGRKMNGDASMKTRGTRGTARGVFVVRQRRSSAVVARAERGSGGGGGGDDMQTNIMSKANELLEKVGLSLGPIGMTLGAGSAKKNTNSDDDDTITEKDKAGGVSLLGKADELLENAGLSLGPIGMTLGESAPSSFSSPSSSSAAAAAAEGNSSIAPMTTEEWRRQFVNDDGTVDLFLEDHYNAPSRLAGGVESDSLTNVENVAWSGLPTDALTGTRHAVKVTDHVTGEVLELEVPEDRYVLFEAEQLGWELPNACRMGCCTKCAVKVTKGRLAQPEALGLSRRYREEGYALLCVSTALSDVECVTQDEEEVYQMQFGEMFQQLATDKSSGAIVRDDFALEIADMDE